MGVLGRGEIGGYGSLIHAGLHTNGCMRQVAIIRGLQVFYRHNAIAGFGDFYKRAASLFFFRPTDQRVHGSSCPNPVFESFGPEHRPVLTLLIIASDLRFRDISSSFFFLWSRLVFRVIECLMASIGLFPPSPWALGVVNPTPSNVPLPVIPFSTQPPLPLGTTEAMHTVPRTRLLLLWSNPTGDQSYSLP